MNLNVLVFISWMQFTFCFNENTSFFYCLMNCLSYTQSYFSAGEEELQCLKYPNAASWCFIAPISQMARAPCPPLLLLQLLPAPQLLALAQCENQDAPLTFSETTGVSYEGSVPSRKATWTESSGSEKGPYGSLWVLPYSSHYRWVSLCSIWEWQASWQVRKAGQSRFAWCRGRTREASLVPVQFKTGYSSPRVRQGPSVGERTEEGKWVSSLLQAGFCQAIFRLKNRPQASHKELGPITSIPAQSQASLCGGRSDTNTVSNLANLFPV